jgi:hypothetical protein
VLAILDGDSKPSPLRPGEHRLKEVTHEDYCDAFKNFTKHKELS